MDFKVRGEVGPQSPANGSNPILRAGRQGELVVSNLLAPYYEAARNGIVFGAHAIVTAPVIFSTAAGTGGPLIWNGTSNKNVVLLSAHVGISVVTTVAASLGITGNTGQTSAPGSTTAIDSRWNALIGGSASGATPYRVGTPTNAGGFFLPFAHLHTGALTVDNLGSVNVDLGGKIIIPPGGWCSIAASATATTTVAQMALIWMEVDIN